MFNSSSSGFAVGKIKKKKRASRWQKPPLPVRFHHSPYFFLCVIFPTAEPVHGLNASLIPSYVPLYQMYMRTEWFCVHPLIFLFFISLVNYVYSLFHANPTRMPLNFVRPRRTLMRRKCRYRNCTTLPCRLYESFLFFVYYKLTIKEIMVRTWAFRVKVRTPLFERSSIFPERTGLCRGQLLFVLFCVFFRISRQQQPSQALTPAILRSWLEFNFAGTSAVKACDGCCCRRRMFWYVETVFQAVPAAMSQVVRRHTRTRLIK